MHDPVEIKVRAATLTIDTVDQFYVQVADGEKPDALVRVLKDERPEQAIVFVRTKIGVDRLARRLGDAGVRVKAMHGDMTQGQRDSVMIAFKGGRERLLVATDVAARGLDITGVSHVINYDVPNSPDVYVHRIGRTGRAGESGRAVTFVTPRQRRELEAIERHAKIEISRRGSADGGGRTRKAARPGPRASRRPRHTKRAPRVDGVPYAKLMVGAGAGRHRARQRGQARSWTTRTSRTTTCATSRCLSGSRSWRSRGAGGAGGGSRVRQAVRGVELGDGGHEKT